MRATLAPSSVTALALLLACSGCTADQQAREFAGRLNRLTIAYEAQVAAKAAAEQEFYASQLDNLSYVVSGRAAAAPAEEAGKSPLDDSFDVKRTLAYGRIATAAQDDATRVAEALLFGNGEPPKTAVIKFLTDGVEADTAAYLDAQRRRGLLQADLLKGLQALDLRKQELKSLREDLARLERQPDPESYAKALGPLIQAVKDELDKPE